MNAFSFFPKQHLSFSKHIYLVVLCLSVMISNLFAQEHYYHFSEKVPLRRSEIKLAIRFHPETSDALIASLLQTHDLTALNTYGSTFGYTIVKRTTKDEEVLQVLAKSASVADAVPLFEFENGRECLVFNRFIAKFKAGLSEDGIAEYNRTRGVEIIERYPFHDRIHILKVVDGGGLDALTMANQYNLAPETEYATPDF